MLGMQLHRTPLREKGPPRAGLPSDRTFGWAFHLGANDHQRNSRPDELLFLLDDMRQQAFTAAGSLLVLALYAQARRKAAVRSGVIHFALGHALAQNPSEWPAFAGLLGAWKVVALCELDDLAWWIGERGPVALLVLLDHGLLWLGLYARRSNDNRVCCWAGAPVQHLCIVHGIRPAEVAEAIAHAFGLEGMPRVAV
jgi:hypothetical protein